MLEATGLGCERGDRLLFIEVELRVHAGEVHELRGPNGAGKTTLLRCLCGLAEPDAGTVSTVGLAAHAQPPFHYLGHADGIKLELSARENVVSTGALHGGPSLARVDDALAQVGLAGIGERPARSLSAGQRRRVALARFALCFAPLWILDEPLTSLDADGVAMVSRLVTGHAHAGGAVIASTHQPLALSGTRTKMHRLASPAEQYA